MTMLDFAKATVACGSLGCLIYRFPRLSQGLLLGILGLLWLLYARLTLRSRRRRHLG